MSTVSTCLILQSGQKKVGGGQSGRVKLSKRIEKANNGWGDLVTQIHKLINEFNMLWVCMQIP